ncbi:MAG: chemotaxis protein CheW [Pseudomonadota bacterium]|nr:chemotaxis protein CheW [Gammaproteobacteria bacterium]MBU1926668.1 chemotaxis protein CheW [Gammaproteobacteria bacterium]MBU2545758.1 chemotaxis protein CheW [Gammaproteobacteria bacterium]
MSNSADQNVLKERAKMYAEKQHEISSKSGYFIRFHLGTDEQYGVAYEDIYEIVNPTEIVPIPLMPEFVAGVINLRSEIFTILDLKSFFNIFPFFDKLESWVIIVGDANMKVGILVDAIISSDPYSPDELMPSIESANITNLDYIHGIFQGEVVLLNTLPLIQDIAKRIKHITQERAQ